MSEVFYVDLVSNASMDVYPSNTLSSFTNTMATPIEFDEQYEVALNEIIYPLDFSRTIEVDYNIYSIKKTPKLIKQVEGSDFKFEYEASWKIKHIISAFTKELEENIMKIDFRDGNKKLTVVKKPKLEYDDKEERVTSTVGQLSDNKTLMVYFQNESFLGPLGFEKTLYDAFFNKASSGEKIQAKYTPYLYAQSNLLFINTDIIEGHRVGNSMSMNLRTIPLSRGPFESVQYMSFTNEFFFPVRFSRIERISIKITDENGKDIRFRGGRVFITLKFRPRFYLG